MNMMAMDSLENSEKITVVQVGEVKREWKKDYDPKQKGGDKDKQNKGNESNNQNNSQKASKQQSCSGAGGVEFSGGNKDKKSLKKQESGADYATVYNTGAITRGKHQKIRKMKEKYADQDEEERQMRMALIGSKQVQGFDIQKHQEYKGGKLFSKGDEDQSESATKESESRATHKNGADDLIEEEIKENEEKLDIENDSISEPQQEQDQSNQKSEIDLNE